MVLCIRQSKLSASKWFLEQNKNKKVFKKQPVLWFQRLQQCRDDATQHKGPSPTQLCGRQLLEHHGHHQLKHLQAAQALMNTQLTPHHQAQFQQNLLQAILERRYNLRKDCKTKRMVKIWLLIIQTGQSNWKKSECQTVFGCIRNRSYTVNYAWIRIKHNRTFDWKRS